MQLILSKAIPAGGLTLFILLVLRLRNLLEQPKPPVGQLLSLFFSLSLIYLGGVWWLDTVGKRRLTFRKVKVQLYFIIVVALTARLLLLDTTPQLSDDIYRYKWDGVVQTRGINPYRFAPLSESLKELRDADWQKINHGQLITIYPPLAELLFYAAMAMKSNIFVMKGMFLLFDVLCFPLILVMLKKRAMDARLLYLYACNPLIIIEFAHGGHLDSAALFLLLLALEFRSRSKWGVGITAFAGSVLIKYFTILAAPFLFLKGKDHVKKGRFVLLFVVLLAAAYIPYLSSDAHPFITLGIYGAHWAHNSLIWELMSPIFPSKVMLRFILAGLVICWLVLLFFRVQDKDGLRVIPSIFAALLLCSPTVHPWYVTWIVPFLCFTRSVSWLLFTQSVLLSYYVLEPYWLDGTWHLPWVVLGLEYSVFLFVFIKQLVSAREKSWRKCFKYAISDILFLLERKNTKLVY